MNYVHTLDKAPKEPHYAALVFKTVYHEGDERSRTNPGHGYPAYNSDEVDYIKFESEAEMLAWVTQQESGYSRNNYQLLFCKPVSIVKELKVSIK